MTIRLFPLFLLLCVLPGLLSAQSDTLARPDWQSYYDRAGVHGCFVLHDAGAKRVQVYNAARCDSAFLPASTYKIFNSLVALETGVVKDENDTIRWDGVTRQIPAWNADQNMRSAIRYSVVWFYQELARRIGERRMQDYASRAHYGNEDISGGIDLFWLQGGLRITPWQQIALLERLYGNDLPFSATTMEKVKDIMILEKTEEFTLRGKTGWAGRVDQEIGWFVGWLERGDDVYFFANCIDIHEERDTQARIGITRAILRDLGLMEP
jgi:beta-lactamase class D